MSADRLRPLAALLVLGTLLASGCSDAFDPFVESEQPFALFGFLDARRDTQFVRVQPITESDTNRVDARVSSTALATGERIVWQDSLLRLDDGRTGTVNFAPFRPQPGETYRIEAVPQGGGGTSAAEITVPAAADFRVAAPTLGENLVVQMLTLDGALRPQAVRVTYTVRRSDGMSIAFAFGYEARSAPSGGGFAVQVNLLRDAAAIRSVLGIDPEGSERPPLLGLRLDYDLVDESQRTANGLGAFGAAARFEVGWTLAPEGVTAIGFVDAQGGG